MIKMSDNNFDKLGVSKSSNSFASMNVSKSGNTFAHAGTKSPNTFASLNLSKSGNTFTNAVVVKSEFVFEGDNTASSPYGGDESTFGTIYGGDPNYGGISHFKNRTTPPGIAH